MITSNLSESPSLVLMLSHLFCSRNQAARQASLPSIAGRTSAPPAAAKENDAPPPFPPGGSGDGRGGGVGMRAAGPDQPSRAEGGRRCVQTVFERAAKSRGTSVKTDYQP